jgi:drug/metabolite transporter (DMT)-like permease
VLVAFLNALCYPLIIVGLPHAPHLTFAALRAFLAGMALTLIAIALRRSIPSDLRTWVTLGFIGLGTTTFAYFGMFHAAEFISPGLATIISNSHPLIAAILAFAFLSERMRRIQYVGLVLGFVGVVVTSLPSLAGNTGFPLGLAYAFLAAAGVAFSNVLMKGISTRVDPVAAMAAQLLLGGVLLAAMALAFEQPLEVDLSLSFMLALFGLAIPGTALSYWLWFWLLGRFPLGRANAFTFLTPFMALTLGIAFFDEQVGPTMIAGLLLTTVGVVIVERGAVSRD